MTGAVFCLGFRTDVSEQERRITRCRLSGKFPQGMIGWLPVESPYMEIADNNPAVLETILDGSRFVRACLRKPIDRTDRKSVV